MLAMDLMMGKQFQSLLWAFNINPWQKNLSSGIFLNQGIPLKNSSRYWERMKSMSVESLDGIRESFCSNNQHIDPDIIQAFGSARPLADQYLLHYAPAWNTNLNKTPVILIHGAGLDANSYTNLYGIGKKGLQQHLVQLGYRVFAITFSHSHGDNFYQAEQVAHAINHVKEICDVEQVDIIAHSKGGTAARIYLSGMAEKPYRGDVRRYVMLGTPNMGLDYVFRNPSVNYAVYSSGANGVLAWDRILNLGAKIDVSNRSIYNDGCFPGQKQLLHRWDGTYALDPMQQDWMTTYYGGEGLMSNSRGIDKAVAEGGFLVSRIDKKGLEPDVQISVLAGDSNFFDAVAGESTGPSDGIVFLESVLYTDGLTKRGAVLREKSTLKVNHMQFLYSRRVASWVNEQLS